MIFLTVGNWHKGFDRLVEAVDQLKAQNLIAEDVLAQIGSGRYKPTNLNAIDYCSPIQFLDFIAKSRLIITHAGIGTIAEALKLKRAVIVVPRKAELGECYDNHQWTTAKQLEKEGKVLVAYEVSELPDKLKKAKNFVPTKAQGGQKIVQAVEEFLNGLVEQKMQRVRK